MSCDHYMWTSESPMRCVNCGILPPIPGSTPRPDPTPAEILAVPMQANDADAATVGDYLRALLACVWKEGESFSGKRPFGNSSWEVDVYTALARAGLVEGERDEDYGTIATGGGEYEADALIARAIAGMGVTP